MKFRAMPGVIRTKICGKAFLVSSRIAMRINETVSFCWEQLEQGADEETLFLCMQEKFDIEDTEELRKDIGSLLEVLYAEHLIERCRQ